MSLHGHTQIILSDAKTGAVQKTIEKDNMLTPALEEIFRPFGMYTNGSVLCENKVNMQRLFGGLLAFDTALDATQVTPPGTANIVAAGVCGQANNGANEIRGTYNSAESNLDYTNRNLRFVYDFATNQGNGTIAAICMTPWWGGYMCECKKRSVEDVKDTFPADGLRYSCYPGTAATGTYSNTFSTIDCGWIQFRRECTGESYSYNTSEYINSCYSKCIEVDEGADTRTTVILKKIYNTTRLTLTVRVRPANIKSGDLFRMMGDWPSVTEKVYELGDALTTENLYGAPEREHICYDWERRTVYITCTPSGSIVAVNAKIRVFALNLDTEEVTTYDITNQTGVRIFGPRTYSYNGVEPVSTFAYNGYLLMMAYDAVDGGYPLYKIKLDDPGKITKFPTAWSSNASCIVYAKCDRLYTTGKYVINMAQNTNNKRFELGKYGDNSYIAVNIRGRDSLLSLNGMHVGLWPATLMTVNNITPIEKTPAQTMKIVYTLREG